MTSMFWLFMFLLYSVLVFSSGFLYGYDSAIDEMKKVRNRK